MDHISPLSSRTRKKICIETLGCAKNEVDSRTMADRLIEAGYSICSHEERYDLMIINTCSFIQSATEESIEAILDALDVPYVQENDIPLIVAGCMPARYGDDLAHEIPEASSFVPCSKEDDIVSIVDQCLSSKAERQESDANECESVELGDDALGLASNGMSPVPVDLFEGSSSPYDRTYAYVKISDGCNRFCSFCTIPYIRGRYASRSLEDIASDVRSLIDKGVKEIILIGQDTGIWGSDFDAPSSLACLIDELASRFDDIRFRVMYIQPEGITDGLIEAVARHGNVCDYFDIPIQHVSSRLLKLMNRSGSAEDFESMVSRIKKVIPDACLRTTVMTGFPTETEDEFEELIDFVQEGYFDYVGVFAYSREEGTRAAAMDGQIDEDEKSFRASKVRDLADAISAEYISRFVGCDLDILVDGREEDDQLFGRAYFQAPEVDGITFVDNGEVGRFGRYRMIDSLLYDLEGETIER